MADLAARGRCDDHQPPIVSLAPPTPPFPRQGDPFTTPTGATKGWGGHVPLTRNASEHAAVTACMTACSHSGDSGSVPWAPPA